MRLTEETLIGDILDNLTGCEDVFLSLGMPCMDCPSARGETVREACEIHDISTGELLEKLRARMDG